MSVVIDIPTISVLVASASVIVGAIYYVYAQELIPLSICFYVR